MVKVERLIEASGRQVKYCSRPEDLLSEPLDLVFEAANPAVVREHLLPLLRSGKDVMLMSIGGLVDPELLKHATELAGNTGRKIILPFGAISGISTLKAAGLAGELDSVTLRSTKAPAGRSLPDRAWAHPPGPAGKGTDLRRQCHRGGGRISQECQHHRSGGAGRIGRVKDPGGDLRRSCGAGDAAQPVRHWKLR